MFFLEAERSLGDPEMRHWHPRIGRATSQNLRDWTYHGPCLMPSDPPGADDSTTWTGSVIRDQGLFWLFYTGTSQAEQGKKQRICAATSTDLITWHKRVDNPILDLDGRWYEEYDPATWYERAWRDPYVIRDPDGAGFHMFFTARVNHGEPSGRGCIGYAHSHDLVSWRTGPPVYADGHFGHLEVPQVLYLDGRWYCLFCAVIDRYSAQHRAHMGPRALSGTHYLVADAVTGPYRLEDEDFFAGDRICSLYAGRLVPTETGLQFLAFEDRDAEGRFIGRICDPIPVTLDAGKLRLVCDALRSSR